MGTINYNEKDLQALPVFEAYLHAELERFKLEQKLLEAKK